jgi:hypothetical protein
MRIFSLRFLALAGICCLAQFASAADFVVFTTNDTGPGSLREAILAANAALGADRVVFNIPGAGAQVISVLSPLPQITDTLEIDGYTQPGAKPNSQAMGSDAVILIQLQGTQNTPDGLIINASNCTIRGLAVTNFIQRNIFFVTGGAGIGVRGGSGNKIEGCFLGIKTDGTTAAPNGFGITIATAAGGTLVGGTSPAKRNVISGNTLLGMLLTANGTQVAGNYIGTDAAGTHAVANPTGIQVGGPHTTTLIGGTVPGAANLISGNFIGLGLGVTTNGIFGGTSDGVTVQGNLVGTAANGVDAISNIQGIVIDGLRNLIGGSTASAGNIIAFNQTIGVAIRNGSGNSILSNSIYSNNTINISLDPASGRSIPNDIGDGDPGPNNLQNFPAIESVAIANNSASIKGNLNSTPNTQFTIQLFSESQSLTDSKQTYLGSTNVTTNGSGDASFTAVLPVPSPDVRINATATSAGGDTSGFFLNVGHFLNISSRARVETGEKVLIAGFILPVDAHIAVRALGPTLLSRVPSPLLDPVLELYRGNSLIATNDNWGDDSNSASNLRNDGLAPTYPEEAGLDTNLFAGIYTVVVRGKNNSAGTAVVEVYDLSDSHSGGPSLNFPNISTRAFVQNGGDVLIGGIIIGRGEGPARVVARAIGPSLANAGVANPLPNPTLELRDSDGILLAANDNWKDSQQTVIEASGLAPQNNAESAIVTRLGPGAYTAIVRDKSGSTGVGLVELYRVP